MTSQFVQTIIDWLLANERSQAWLARKARVTPFYLNLCLHGHRQPSEKLLRRLESLMDLNPFTLIISRNGEPEDSNANHS